MGWFWSLRWREAFTMTGIWGLIIALLIVVFGLRAVGNPAEQPTREDYGGLMMLIASLLLLAFFYGLMGNSD